MTLLFGFVSFDADVPSLARMWNYWLGGMDNFASDRKTAERVTAVLPAMPLIARRGRRFLVDVVNQMVTVYGVRQFLDIGSGLPTADNTHEIVLRAAPDARVVYVDNDPAVLNHARVLLTTSPEGSIDYILADLRDTAAILAKAARTLDFTEPVVVLLIGVLHFIQDDEDPYGILSRLVQSLPSGSYLVIGHGASDIEPAAAAEMARQYNERSPVKIRLRSREEVARFVDGMELVGPGLVRLDQWSDGEPGAAEAAEGLAGYSVIARKP